MVRKLYTDKEYSDKACEANTLGKKLIKVQDERPYNIEVYEYEKKTIEVTVIDPETGEPTGETKTIEVDDLDKPIMVEETIINPITGEEEIILVHKHHTETRTEIVEYLDIVDNQENFQRCFFNTCLGYVRRKPFVKGTGEFKDFLDDILSGLKVGDEIITYTAEGQQQIAVVTEQFIEDCRVQYTKDFYGEQ